MQATRTKPPARRTGISFEFVHAHQPYMATLNWDATGRPIEIFIEYGKDGASPLGHMARDAGIALSFSLQLGASLTDLRNAVSRDTEHDAYGQPKAPADFGPAIGPAQSIIGAALDAAVDEFAVIGAQGKGNGGLK